MKNEESGYKGRFNYQLKIDDKINSRNITICLFLIGLILMVSMFANHSLIGVLLLTVPAVFLLLAGSPLRILMLALSLQIILSRFVLQSVNLLIFRPDELLILFLMWLWILSLPDGSMKETRIGITGLFIILFIPIYVISALRGYSSGNDQTFLIISIKTYGGYLLYFPFLWVLSNRGNREWLWKALLASAVVGALIYTIMGYRGYGEYVYFRETTGVRVVTRQPNAFAVVLLCFVGRLWKDWKNRPPILIIVPILMVIGSAILVAQSRSIWGGIILGLVGAWILNLFRREDRVRISRKLIISVTTLAVMLALMVLTISATGILSASNIARRTETETGSYFTDASALAHIMAFSAILQDLQGSSMIFGKGMAAGYTCFRPDYGAVITVPYVDSSYFQIALNMGVVGVIILLGIFLSAIVKSARVFLKTRNNLRAGICLGVFSSLIMLLFTSNFAGTITNYRYTLLWTLLLAIAQSETIREKTQLLTEDSRVPPVRSG